MNIGIIQNISIINNKNARHFGDFLLFFFLLRKYNFFFNLLGKICNHDVMNNKTVVMNVNIHQVGEIKEIIKLNENLENFSTVTFQVKVLEYYD